MTCTRGCCATPAEHYRSLRVAAPDRQAMTKTTVDDHGAQGSVEVVQHWHDRQDVYMRPATVRTSWGRHRQNAPGAPAVAHPDTVHGNTRS